MAHHKINKNNYKVSLIQQSTETSITDVQPKEKRQHISKYKISKMRKKVALISEIKQTQIKQEYHSTLLIPEINQSSDQIRVYTDASYSIETKIAVTSFIITRNDERIYSQSNVLHKGNGSTFAELAAIDNALDFVYFNINPIQPIELYTDSKMSVNILQEKVKLKQSKREYHQIVNNIKTHENTNFIYIKAHTKGTGLHSGFNHQADQLCKAHLREVVASKKNED